MTDGPKKKKKKHIVLLLDFNFSKHMETETKEICVGPPEENCPSK